MHESAVFLVAFLFLSLPFASVVFKFRALTTTRLQFLGITVVLTGLIVLSQNSAFMWMPLGLLMAAVGTRCNALRVSNTWRLMLTFVPAIGLFSIPYFLIKGGSGLSKIFLAAADGNIEELGKLVAKGEDVNQLDYRGATALFYAARNGRSDAVNMLLINGANPSIQLKSGMTAEDIAAKNGQFQTAEVLRQFSYSKFRTTPIIQTSRS